MSALLNAACRPNKKKEKQIYLFTALFELEERKYICTLQIYQEELRGKNIMHIYLLSTPVTADLQKKMHKFLFA